MDLCTRGICQVPVCSGKPGKHLEARYPSGKGEVCKTFMRRFDPDPRLQCFPSQMMLRNASELCHVCARPFPPANP